VGSRALLLPIRFARAAQHYCQSTAVTKHNDSCSAVRVTLPGFARNPCDFGGQLCKRNSRSSG
jgi:hypothetical protein